MAGPKRCLKASAMELDDARKLLNKRKQVLSRGSCGPPLTSVSTLAELPASTATSFF